MLQISDFLSPPSSASFASLAPAWSSPFCPSIQPFSSSALSLDPSTFPSSSFIDAIALPLPQLTSLRIMPGTLAILRPLSLPSTTPTASTVYAHVFALPDEQASTHDAWISPLLAHRLSSPHLTSPLYVTVRAALAAELELPVANSVILKRVCAPEAVLPSTSTMRQVFGHARLLVHGQVVPVDVCVPEAPESSSSLDVFAHAEAVLEAVTRVTVFFQVCVVSPKPSSSRATFVVDPTRTRLVQEGSVQCAVPWMQPVPLSGLAEAVRRLLAPRLLPVSAAARLESSVLLLGARRAGKCRAVRHAARSLHLHYVERNMFELLGGTEKVTADKLAACFEEAAEMAPAVLHIRRFSALTELLKSHGRKDNILLSHTLRTLVAQHDELLVVASAESRDDVPASIRACFQHVHEIQVPNAEQRKAHLLPLVETDEQAEQLSAQSAGLSVGALESLAGDAWRAALARGPSARLAPDDLESAVRAASERAASVTGTLAQSPNVKWSDVGGLETVKHEIMDAVELPLRMPGLFASGGVKQRSGILLFGPPGTGKTLMAKAVATECSLNFISVKGPELLNMYVGESEKNVRDVFQRARDARPCILFFDEMDSIAPARGQGSDGGGVMDRVVSQLLTELDGMDTSSGDVFVIGATNRPDLLDPALLRPGRLDRCVYLGVSQDDDAQCKILQALTRKFELAPDVDLMRVAQSCPFTFTGADFYALCSDAMINALKRQIEYVDNALPPDVEPRSFLASLPEDDPLLQVQVAMLDFTAAKAKLVPSLSAKELAHYAQLKQQFAPSQV